MDSLTILLKKHPRTNKVFFLKADNGKWHPITNKNYSKLVFENNSDDWLVKSSHFTYINGIRTLMVDLEMREKGFNNGSR